MEIIPKPTNVNNQLNEQMKRLSEVTKEVMRFSPTASFFLPSYHKHSSFKNDSQHDWPNDGDEHGDSCDLPQICSDCLTFRDPPKQKENKSICILHSVSFLQRIERLANQMGKHHLSVIRPKRISKQSGSSGPKQIISDVIRKKMEIWQKPKVKASKCAVKKSSGYPLPGEYSFLKEPDGAESKTKVWKLSQAECVLDMTKVRRWKSNTEHVSISNADSTQIPKHDVSGSPRKMQKVKKQQNVITEKAMSWTPCKKGNGQPLKEMLLWYLEEHKKLSEGRGHVIPTKLEQENRTDEVTRETSQRTPRRAGIPVSPQSPGSKKSAPDSSEVIHQMLGSSKDVAQKLKDVDGLNALVTMVGKMKEDVDPFDDQRARRGQAHQQVPAEQLEPIKAKIHGIIGTENDKNIVNSEKFIEDNLRCDISQCKEFRGKQQVVLLI